MANCVHKTHIFDDENKQFICTECGEVLEENYDQNVDIPFWSSYKNKLGSRMDKKIYK